MGGDSFLRRELKLGVVKAARSPPSQPFLDLRFFVLILGVLCNSRWSEKIFPRSLSVSLPRATLVAWWTQSHCKPHLFLDYFAMLVMTKNRWPRGTRPLAMTIHTTFAMTPHSYTCCKFLVTRDDLFLFLFAFLSFKPFIEGDGTIGVTIWRKFQNAVSDGFCEFMVLSAEYDRPLECF